MKRIIGICIIFATVSSCAWFQKHSAQINCVGTATVQDAPKLIQAISTCASAAGDVPACLISLINPTWNWTRDVVACFTDMLAGDESLKCTASASAAPLDQTARDKLKVAAAANGWAITR